MDENKSIKIVQLVIEKERVKGQMTGNTARCKPWYFVEVWLQSFLTLILLVDGGECLVLCPSHLNLILTEEVNVCNSKFIVC